MLTVPARGTCYLVGDVDSGEAGTEDMVTGYIGMLPFLFNFAIKIKPR